VRAKASGRASPWSALSASCQSFLSSWSYAWARGGDSGTEMQCMASAKHNYAHGRQEATVRQRDWVEVEKVTNAARRCGGPRHHCVMRCDRMHTVCLDDARQWRGQDGLVPFRKRPGRKIFPVKVRASIRRLFWFSLAAGVREKLCSSVFRCGLLLFHFVGNRVLVARWLSGGGIAGLPLEESLIVFGCTSWLTLFQTFSSRAFFPSLLGVLHILAQSRFG
jgi:hypothetical protein